jgi:hypothetical protein
MDTTLTINGSLGSALANDERVQISLDGGNTWSIPRSPTSAGATPIPAICLTGTTPTRCGLSTRRATWAPPRLRW